MKVMSNKYAIWSIVLTGLIAISNLTLFASEALEHGESAKAIAGDPYYLTTCPVSGQKLGEMGKPVLYNHDGREIRFCCAGCVAQFKKDPQKFISKLDEAMIKDQLPFYPLETCLVTKQKLTSMGKPVDVIYKNRLVRFCCNNCVAQFEKDPDEYIRQLNAAVIQQQKEDYPLANCMASGEKLGGSMGDPIDIVIANRLIRLCCPSCQKMLQENPSEYLSKLEAPHGEHEKIEDNQSDHSEHQH